MAHEFGLDTSSMSAEVAILLGARRPTAPNMSTATITDATLKKWLGVLDICATAIDGHLLPDFIGGYEVAAIYVDWERDSDALYKTTGIPPYGSGSPAKRLSKFLGAWLNYPIQYEMAQAIMNFVDGL